MKTTNLITVDDRIYDRIIDLVKVQIIITCLFLPVGKAIDEILELMKKLFEERVFINCIGG